MSDATTAHRVRTVRRWRAVMVVCIVVNVATAAFEVTTGSVFAVIPLLALVLCVLHIRQEAATARRLQRAVRQPDYLVIARLECEIYGEAFHHEGSPYLGDFHPSDFPSQR